MDKSCYVIKKVLDVKQLVPLFTRSIPKFEPIIIAIFELVFTNLVLNCSDAVKRCYLDFTNKTQRHSRTDQWSRPFHRNKFCFLLYQD